MHCFVCTDFHPVIRKFRGKLVAEASDEIKGQINSHKFNVGEGMEQRNAVGERAPFTPPGHMSGGQELRIFGACGRIGHDRAKTMRYPSQPPVASSRPGSQHLGMGVSGQEDGLAGLAEGAWLGDFGVHPSAFAAPSTSAA